MKKMLLPLAFSVLVFSACSNADPKKMANELCDCVQSKKKLSSQSKKIVLKASKSGEEFMTAVQTEVQKIDDQEKMQEVSDEINKFFQLIQSKKTIACANEIDKKYRVMKSDEKDIQKQTVEEMQDVEGCEAYAAILKLGMAKTGKKTVRDDEEETADEEKPRRKKTTNETEEEEQ